MKAILEITAPTRCVECQFCNGQIDKGDSAVCLAVPFFKFIPYENLYNTRADFCPLKIVEEEL